MFTFSIAISLSLRSGMQRVFLFHFCYWYVPSGTWCTFKVLHTFTLLSNQFNHYGIRNKITSITRRDGGGGETEPTNERRRENGGVRTRIYVCVCVIVHFYSIVDCNL